MDGTNGSEQDVKPFSVLEKFRQLKKEKVNSPVLQAEKSANPKEETPGSTVFQTTGSPTTSSSEDLKRGGFRNQGFGRFGRRGGKRSFNDPAERPSKRIAADLWRGQKEADVGITEYVRSGLGFDVLLKHRYTDFHVNEIDTEGNVVRFTSIDIPKKKEEKRSAEEDPTVLSPEQWAALGDIVANKLPGTVDKDVTDLSKEERQKIHKAVKMRFGVHVFSNTATVDGRKVMKIGYGTNNKVQQRWPDDRPEYLHFVVLKENCDTSEAIHVLSQRTHVKANKFSYAGTKDKRAVTTQQMCLRRVEAERFHNCRILRSIYLGNFCYKWKNLRLGDLSGNRFKLVLRNVKVSDEVIEEAVESLKTNGFINYFGMQRFGQSALVPTHLVGQAMLKGDFKLATELILKPRPGEATFQDLRQAREVWWETRDAAEALKCLGRKERSIEGKVLTALKKHGPNAYQNAFDALPHHTVTLYLHSYQSLVWNKVVSRRVREVGLRVLPGDLVTDGGQDRDRDRDLLAYRMQDCVKEVSGGRESDSSEGEEDSDQGKDGCKIPVRVLSAEEAEKASIFDVVLPLPGDDIRYPDNEIASWYKEIIEADGHSLSSFGKVHKRYGMYGTYRKILETVDDLNWRIQRYSDPDEDLLLSDYDIYNGRPPLNIDPDGPYKAIIIEFNLKTCSYATMAIRELTKCETSVVNQTKLTNQAREEDSASKKSKEVEEETMELKSEAVVESEQINSSLENNSDSSQNEAKDSEQPVKEETKTESVIVKTE